MRNELARSKVTTQDQTSVPLEVRRRFGIKSGCELGWYEEDGRLYVDLARVHTLADARAARTWLSLRAGVPEKEIVVMGESLGGAVAAYWQAGAAIAHPPYASGTDLAHSCPELPGR